QEVVEPVGVRAYDRFSVQSVASQRLSLQRGMRYDNGRPSAFAGGQPEVSGAGLSAHQPAVIDVTIEIDVSLDVDAVYPEVRVRIANLDLQGRRSRKHGIDSRLIVDVLRADEALDHHIGPDGGRSKSKQGSKARDLCDTMDQ